MISSQEMSAQLKQTQAFIDADPVTLTMRRRQRVRDADTGAWVWQDEVPVVPDVVVKLSPAQLTSQQVPEINTPGGQEEWPELNLIAMPGADIQKNDIFTWDGIDWKIDEIHLLPDYEFGADVIRYAG